MNINDLIREAHENAVAHGWWEEERPFAELVALMIDLNKAIRLKMEFNRNRPYKHGKKI